jgi:hypothetical protein
MNSEALFFPGRIIQLLPRLIPSSGKVNVLTLLGNIEDPKAIEIVIPVYFSPSSTFTRVVE